MSNIQGQQRLNISAAALHKAFNIPPIYAPPSQDARAAILEACLNDPRAIVDSLTAYRDHLAAGEGSFTGVVTQSMWKLFSLDDANVLMSRDSRVILSIVESAVRLRPLPSREKLFQFKRLVRSATHAPYWSAFALELISAWLAEYFAAVNDYDARSDYLLREQSKVEAAKRWPSAAARAVEWPGQPLGVNVRTDIDVDEWLTNALASLGE